MSGAAFVFTPSGKVAQKLIPYVIPPSEITPGTWSHFATTCRECPAGCGMQVRHIDGRVIKTEGNPDHPLNGGALCARGQSSVQGLYDPDRITQPLFRAPGTAPRPAAWPEAIRSVGTALRESRGRVAVLSNLQTGALAEIMQQFAAVFASPHVIFYEPFNYEALRRAHEKIFGLPVIPEYRLEDCDFVLSLAADFLETWISPVQFARTFADSHSYRSGRRGRLCYAGPRLSMTAANADEFLQGAPGAERMLALGLLKTIMNRGWNKGDTGWIAPLVKPLDLKPILALTGLSAARLELLAQAFVEAKASVALAGPTGAGGTAAVETAMAAALLNVAAGRLGQTVRFDRPHALSATALNAAAKKFFEDLREDDVLIIHEANPVYSFPGVVEHIRRVKTVIYLGPLMDETASLAAWFLPTDSPLESWGDYEPYPGMCGLMQPTMARLHDTRNAGDILLASAAGAGRPLRRAESPAPAGSFEEWLRQRWSQLGREATPAALFETFWHTSVRNGGFWKAPPEVAAAVSPRPAGMAFALPGVSAPRPSAAEADLWAWPAPMLFDGRVANRGWLQEAPDPMSTIVWESWVDLHPEKARQLGVTDGTLLELENAHGKIRAPARLTCDVQEDTAALAFGQGHDALGRNAAGRGANVFRLCGEPPENSLFGRVRLRKVPEQHDLLATCATRDQHQRSIIQWVDLAALNSMRPGDGDSLRLPLPEGYDRKQDLYAPHPHPDHRWAMAIDLDRCNGCGACAVACYAENNLAVVGAEQAGRGREMAWLRVAPYRDDENEQRIGFIPMLCQQCDAAPCEPVCPVFASVHDAEGLNAQVYNRCIGTRYCSHNCPYKVRRFNWLDTRWAPPLDRQLNPDVSVRCRGVMEKCNFCVQRIRDVERRAKREARPVRDGEIKPACVQTCPAKALIFGDLLDPASRVSDYTRRDPRRYHVLEELNTKPAITYLRRVKWGGLCPKPIQKLAELRP